MLGYQTKIKIRKQRRPGLKANDKLQLVVLQIRKTLKS